MERFIEFVFLKNPFVYFVQNALNQHRYHNKLVKI